MKTLPPEHASADFQTGCERVPVKPVVGQLKRADVLGVGLTGTYSQQGHLCKEYYINHIKIYAKHSRNTRFFSTNPQRA